MIRYIEEVIEKDYQIFQEKIYDYEFIEYVRHLHIKYINKNFNLSIEDMTEKFEDEDENKKAFANFYNLEYSRINDLEYLGIVSVKVAREYLEEIQSLPQKH